MRPLLSSCCGRRLWVIAQHPNGLLQSALAYFQPSHTTSIAREAGSAWKQSSIANINTAAGCSEGHSHADGQSTKSAAQHFPADTPYAIPQHSTESFRDAASTAATQPLQTRASSSSSNSSSSSSSSSSLTEEQLAELFDQELQQRLERAAQQAAERVKAAASSPSGSFGGQAPAPATATAVPSSAGAVPSATRLSDQGSTLQQDPSSLPSSSRWTPSVQAVPRALPLAPGVSPLLSADPWAPLPSSSLARQRLPEQLLLLLHQAGVPRDVAADALQEVGSITGSVARGSSSNSNSSSPEDETPSVGWVADSTSTSSSSSRSGSAQARKLFGQPGVPATRQSASQQQQAPPARRQQQPSLLSVLNKLQTKQLVQLLEECQAPAYGSKELLLGRIVLLLQEQQLLKIPAEQQQPDVQQEQHQEQDAKAEPQLGFGGPGGSEHMPAALKPVGGQQELQASSRRELEGPTAAAQQELRRSVLDVQQVGRWLLAARAQDVCIVDVRGRAGLQAYLVIATGLNQRHTRALAEAVAWQLQQVAQEVWQQQQQQQQQQQPGDNMQSQHFQQQQQEQQPQQLQRGPDWQVEQQLSERQQFGPAVLQHLEDLVAQHAQQHEQQQQQQQRQKQQQHKQKSAGEQHGWQALLPPLNVVGDASSEWCLLDAGSITVHVLTERARRFYALENLWGGPQGRYIQWLKAGQQQQIETKDTIGRPVLGA